MKIPGALWGALMVALPLISVWLEQNFGAYAWTPAVAGLLLIVVKVIAVMREGDDPAAPGDANMEVATYHRKPDSKAKRILLG